LLLSTVPAYEPRLGGVVLGVPQQVQATPTPPVAAAAASPDLDALSRLPFALPKEPPRDSSTSGVSLLSIPGAEPHFYFADTPTPPATAEARQAQAQHWNHQGAHPAFDVHAVRRDFPILQERVNGKPLVWLDNAATTQKPQAVIDRLSYFYQHENSNIHRAAHELAARATEAINLVAKSWGWQHVGEGDEIIVSQLEHHANIVPWQQLAAAKGAKLRVIPVDDDGQVRLDEYTRLLNPRTRIVSVTQVSNALGTVVPVKDIVALAKRVGAVTLVDGAQSVSHMQVDVQDIGCDFFVFSGHKIFGPTGIGALWGKREVLEDMPPWQGGGNMIADVTFEKTVFQPLPNTFEAGTGNIADAVGLGAALAYVQRLGLPNIARYEHELLCHGMAALREIKGLRLIGTAPDKASVMSFVLNNYTTQEVGEALNREGIAVRTGHHCAQPILRRFGLETTVRPSLAFYNTHEEVDLLVRTVHKLAQARY
jgi:cysteine desulfurase / selenocysteine lyase